MHAILLDPPFIKQQQITTSTCASIMKTPYSSDHITSATSCPLLFMGKEEVIAITADVMPLCTAMQAFDGLTAVAHGLLRGVSKQSVSGYINLATYYLVGLPISAATAFILDWRLGGL
ncbi:hypothetical protein DL768_008838 [Monosporascus sp. mg162]|nr:hypothetical protein DL768_008838 [Monosporascus sp. mg162]